MTEIRQRLVDLERRLARERGPFSFFGLFLREDASGKWDLVVAADWIDEDRIKALQYLAKELQSELAKDVTVLSRIVLMEQDGLDAMHRFIQTEHSDMEVRDSVFFGLSIKHAFIVTSMRRDGDGPSQSQEEG